MGSAHRWWRQRLGLPDAPKSEFEILRRGTLAPIGNLRIEEALPQDRLPPLRFPRRAVVERENAFIDYAAEAGAHVGGATGAGGDSPKLLLRQDADEQVWIDVWQDEATCPDRHFLVKFARSREHRDRLILLRGIIRTTRWEGCEAGREVDWQKLLPTFGREEAVIRAGLRELAQKLRDLPDLLEELGLPEQTLHFPGLSFRETDRRLERWGL